MAKVETLRAAKVAGKAAPTAKPTQMVSLPKAAPPPAKPLATPKPPIEDKLYFIVDEHGNHHGKFMNRLRALEAADRLVRDRAYSIVESADGRSAAGKVVHTYDADPDLVRKKRERGGPRAPKYPPTTKLKCLVKDNPKKAGAAERFAAVMKAKTLGEALEGGYTTADLSYDIKKGYVEVVQ
jgi:hypothetical protein